MESFFEKILKEIKREEKINRDIQGQYDKYKIEWEKKELIYDKDFKIFKKGYLAGVQYIKDNYFLEEKNPQTKE